MNEQDNPYYCPLIFNGMYVEKINDQKVKVSACCVNELGPEIDVIDFENDPHLVAQRQLLKANQKLPGCGQCNNNNTVFNLRHNALSFFRDSRLPVDPDRPVLNKLDWNVDPICNARCIQCSAHFSSAWAAEDAAHGKKAIPVRLANTTRHNNIANSIDLANIKNIYFNGGEPFLTAEPLEFLKQVDDLGIISDLAFSTNTNGSIRPKQELIDYFRKCRSVVINFSIDGTESEFEYIRDQLKWSEVNDNIQWLIDQSLTNLSIGIGFTLGIHNIDLVERTAAWADSLRRPSARIRFGIHPCHGSLSLEYSTEKMKQIWREKFQHLQRFKTDIFTMLDNTANAPDNTVWQQHLDMIDRRRNLNWKQRLPDLYEVWKKSQEL